MATYANISLTLPRSLLADIDKVARQRSIGRSQCIREMCLESLEGKQAEAFMLGNEAIRTALVQAFTRPEVMAEFQRAISSTVDRKDLQKVFGWLEKGPPTSKRARVSPRVKGSK